MKKRIKLWIIISITLVITLLILTLYLLLNNSFQKVNYEYPIESILLNKDKSQFQIKFADNILSNLSEIELHFLNKNKSYSYSFTEGLETPLKSEYKISAEDLGLDSLSSISKINVVYKSADNLYSSSAYSDRNNKNNTATNKTTGRRGGGSGGGGGGGCTPQCSGKQCGSDGCGGSCGTCLSGEICTNGLCVNNCTNDIGCIASGIFCNKNQTYNCNITSNGCFVRNNLSQCFVSQVCINLTGCVDIPLCSNNSDCSSLNDQCNIGKCNPTTGCFKQAKTNGTTCDDNNLCTLNDVCSNGACQSGSAKVCTPSNDCRLSSCSSLSGNCVETNKPDGTICNTGLYTFGPFSFLFTHLFKIFGIVIASSNVCSNGECVDDTLPSYCPHVSFDGNKNILVNGNKIFPVGFWAFYFDPDFVSINYKDYFNFIIDDIDYEYNYINRSDTLGKVKMLSQSAVTINGNQVQPRRVLEYMSNSNVIFWEVQHEPDSYASYIGGKWVYSSMYGNVSEQARVIRNTDICKRPVFLTPSGYAATGQYLVDHEKFADIVGSQSGYGIPVLALAYNGIMLESAVNISKQKPVISILNIQGYQSKRIRNYAREASVQELRAESYDSIIHGAKGIAMYSFGKGAGDLLPIEPWDAYYNLLDSPKRYQSIKNLALDLKSSQEIFFSNFSKTVSVNAPNNINCKSWDVFENNKNVNYVICVNVGETTSPYFGYAAGATEYLIKAHLMNASDGYTINKKGVFSEFECSDGNDNDRDGIVDLSDPDCSSWNDDEEGTLYARDLTMDTNKIYIAPVKTGYTYNNYTVNYIYLNFAYVPGTSNFDYAIYSDGNVSFVNTNPNEDSFFDINRDEAPDTKIISGSSSISSAGIKIIQLPDSIKLEHTRYYWIVIKMNSPNVKIKGRDGRSGVTSLDNNAGFMSLTSQAPQLRQGKQITGDLTLANVSTSYCVKKSMNGNFISGTLTNGKITETFEPYGVYIYKFGDQTNCI